MSSSWLNFNDSLNNLKGQITNFAQNVLADEDTGLEGNTDLTELRNIIAKQELEIKKLRQDNEELQKKDKPKSSGINDDVDSWPEWSSEELQNSENSIPALKAKIQSLEQDKIELCQQLDQLDADNQQALSGIYNIKEKLHRENVSLKETNEKLKHDLEKLSGAKNDAFHDLEEVNRLKIELEEAQKEISLLKSSNETLQKVYNDSKLVNEGELKQLQAENKIVYNELQNAKKALEINEESKKEADENYHQISALLENYSKQVEGLTKDLNESLLENERLTNKFDELKVKYDLIVQQREEMHKKYVNVITENVKLYNDCDNPSDLQESISKSIEVNDPIEEFSNQVRTILKISLDLKSKCSSLERDIMALTEEKRRIIAEKNAEIEKLIQNSEMLSHDLIRKTEIVKEYENECDSLAKNNDLLITELDTLRNASPLQTISESNEDNMVLLENQLENSNKKIECLEKIISELESKSSELDLENAFNKITIENKDYELVLRQYDELEINYKSLENELKELRTSLDLSRQENDQFKILLEKSQNDYEITDYKLSEANVQIDALKEDIEIYKSKLNNLETENKELKLKIIDLDNLESLKTELNILQEKLRNEEQDKEKIKDQIKNMTEKLQDAKMIETTLKLQLSKEMNAANELKNNLELALNELKLKVQDSELSYSTIQNKYEDLKNSFEDLQKEKVGKDQQIMNFEKLVEELNEKLQQYENLAIEENRDLFKKLSISEESPEDKLNGMDVEEVKNQFEKLDLQENKRLQSELSGALEKINFLEIQLNEMTKSRDELISIVTTKHQESITYHNEIQRLSQILQSESDKIKLLENQLVNINQIKETVTKKDEEIDKLTDQINFLREKCDVLTKNLLEEQGKVQKILSEKTTTSDKEQALENELKRLRSHVLEVEEYYTNELVQAERKNAELLTKVNEIEQREKDSSTLYTSVSIRANQQVEVLQKQIELLSNQRDELMRKLSDAEDNANKQTAALTNLQVVLEQFQRDRENDIKIETERIRRQIKAEQQIQADLKNEIVNLKQQLEESKQGLQAANRLSDQLELSKKNASSLKEEVNQLKEMLQKAEEKLRQATSQTDGKVDKSLIKNLIIGYISSNNNSLNKDQTQILKIIATVLDFNQQDHDKIKMNKPQQGWLSSLLLPPTNDSAMSQESLSQAFIKFLENESKPRVIPSLLDNPQSNLNEEESAKVRKISTASSSRHSPIVLSEIVLPTFPDFAQSRNSSSILKDVLKDNST